MYIVMTRGLRDCPSVLGWDNAEPFARAEKPPTPNDRVGCNIALAADWAETLPPTGWSHDPRSPTGLGKRQAFQEG